MMERLREGVNSIAVKIILGLIILSFIFAGIGNYLISGGKDVAAEVGSIDISRTQFEQAYQNERNRIQAELAQKGEDVSELFANQYYVQMLRQKVLNELVNTTLLDQYAQSLGLTVTDKQVRQAIIEAPEFQKDGQFDQETYQRLLRQAGLTADGYAESLRSGLLRNQLVMAIQGSDFSLKGETEAQNALFTQTRDIRQLTLSVQEFADKVKLGDEDIQAYYDSHSEVFTRPEQYKLSYVELSAEQLAQQQTVSDEEAQRYYQENKERYSSIEQRKISHILVKDEQKAEELLAQLQQGAEFATLAQEQSEDVGSAKEGGSLGWIQRGDLGESIDTAVFELKNVGDFSGVVHSEFGYHIIQLNDIKPAQAKPFADVAEAIKRDVVNQKAADKFDALSQQLEKVAFDAPNELNSAAQAIEQQVHKTDFVSQQELPEILNHKAVLEAIQSPDVQEDGMNSEVIEIAPQHLIVVRVDDLRPETVLPLNEVKEQVVAQLSQEKGAEQASELAKQIITELKEGKHALLDQHQLTFGDAETIDRRSPMAKTVFAMAKPVEGKPSFAQTSAANQDVVIIQLDAVNEEADSQLHDSIEQQLFQMNAQNSVSDILETLREQEDVKVYSVSQ